ncbi:MAG: AIPR family protein [Lachnospiraceae bacterium]|nr:AIPR family protein [Lachnospiraceae bacterium]
MDEKDLLNSVIDNAICEGEYEDFDHMLFDNYFEEIIPIEDLSRIKTDNYGDAGNDYIFFTFNRNLVLDINDIEEFDTAEGGDRIDLYFIQVKDTTRLDSNVPNKFIEFSSNLINGKTKEHYNEEVNDNIILFSNLVKKYALKAKFYINFYYFSRFSKEQLKSATDLNGRFDTLKSIFDVLDFVENVKVSVESVNSIVKKLKEDKKFEYTFNEVGKFEAEVNKEEGKTNSIIALIPITQFYNFITYGGDGQINDRLFESNIRDYKGRSNVNKNIIETLKNPIGIDFWWLNNGITITVEDVEESKSANKIKLVNPQIVNGLQTSYSIYNFFSDNSDRLADEKRKVFVKILKVDQNNEDQELNIIVATNSQNEIRDKDIHANDAVQKNIEEYLKRFDKYYQRKDKYYTNRKIAKKDIIKLSEMAKYINTIYLKDPAYTRNNPGKLLSGTKYRTIFQIENINQNYERYFKAYEIYNKVMALCKGIIKIGEDEFEKTNFIHHIVYVLICNEFTDVNYKPSDIYGLDASRITEEKVGNAIDCLVSIIEENGIAHTKILKTIKEQSFNQMINNYLVKKFREA